MPRFNDKLKHTPVPCKKRAAKRPERAKTDAFCLICKSMFKVEVVREYRFHPTRMWRFDYAILEPHKISIEVEGGIWGAAGSRHTHPAGFKADIEKYNQATLLGWRVFRALPEQIIKTALLDLLQEAINPIKTFSE